MAPREVMRLVPQRAPLLGAALYLAAFVTFAAYLGTWTDEEYTLATTAHGFVFAWRRAIDYELQAPLYFAVLAVWRQIDAGVGFARLFSILCATGFFVAMLAIMRRAAPGRPAFWPALFVAVNPFVVYTALDIRLYAPALLLAALGWLAFDAGFVSQERTAARVCFVAISIVELYTQYFLGFALVGYAVALVVTGRRRALAPYAVALIAIGLATLPLLGIVRSQIGGSGETTASVAKLVRATLTEPTLEFLLPYEAHWNVFHLRGVYFALVALALALVVYARPKVTGGLLRPAACAATIVLMFLAVVLAFRLDLETRHYVVLFVPVMVAGYALLGAIEAGTRPAVGAFLRVAYVVLTAGVLYAQHGAVAADGDAIRVANYLAANTQPGAIIAVFPADALPAYARAYRGHARLLPFPQRLPAKRYDIEAIDVHDEAEARRALAALPQAPQTWFVMLGACDRGFVSYGCQYVLSAIRDGARTLRERRFFDSRVLELQLRR